MELETLERMMAQLLLDERLRNKLYSTSEEESELLKDNNWSLLKLIPREDIEMAAMGLPKKRLIKMRSIFPHLYAMLGTDFDRIFDLFSVEIVPSADELIEAKNFTLMVETLVGFGKIQLQAIDISKYDRILLELRNQEPEKPDNVMPWHPKLSNTCRIETFQFDVSQIIQDLKEGARLSKFVRRWCTLLIQIAHGKCRLFRLGPALVKLLSRCDGHSTVQELDLAFKDEFPNLILEDSLGKFRERGVLV
jgi:hypothetical protein